MLMISIIAFIWITIAILVKVSRMPGRIEALEKEKRELERRIEELRREHREEIERMRKHYEILLRDAAIKNTMMVALYNAWRSGLLKKCYSDGGELRVLSDGTCICELPEKEKSYAISVEVPIEEVEDLGRGNP